MIDDQIPAAAPPDLPRGEDCHAQPGAAFRWERSFGLPSLELRPRAVSHARGLSLGSGWLDTPAHLGRQAVLLIANEDRVIVVADERVATVEEFARAAVVSVGRHGLRRRHFRLADGRRLTIERSDAADRLQTWLDTGRPAMPDSAPGSSDVALPTTISTGRHGASHATGAVGRTLRRAPSDGSQGDLRPPPDLGTSLTGVVHCRLDPVGYVVLGDGHAVPARWEHAGAPPRPGEAVRLQLPVRTGQPYGAHMLPAPVTRDVPDAVTHQAWPLA